jgi:acetyl esterase/lipase
MSMLLTLLLSLASIAHGEIRDIPYLPDNGKQKLDLYLPEGKTNFPVMVFIHGGAWRIGDRSMYRKIGEHFSQEGIGVVIPSYRLAPLYRHPAQIEDVAAAFAWTVRNIASRGGDVSRIYLVGHSSGGHLASLLALDGSYLAAFGLSPRNIAGVVSMSGVYSIGQLEWNFGPSAKARKAASPLEHVQPGAPPFLIMYCQWDYLTLAGQAKQFHKALLKAGVKCELLRLPGKNHINEVYAIAKENDLGEKAIVRFLH